TDNGVHSFSATFKTAGTYSLSATDIATSSITGTQSSITVNAAALASATSSLATVSYQGGPLLKNVQIESVYDGQAWNTTAYLAQRIPQPATSSAIPTTPTGEKTTTGLARESSLRINDILGESSRANIGPRQPTIAAFGLPFGRELAESGVSFWLD